MSVNPKNRRKTRLKKDTKPYKSNISKKDKVNGIIMLLGILIMSFLLYWFVLNEIL